MKAILKFTTVAAFLLMVSIGKAEESKSDLFVEKEEKSMVFKLDAQVGKAILRFADANGTLIFSESIAQKIEYSKKFDLNNLDQGEYTFSIDDKLKKVTYTLELTRNEVRIIKKKEVAKPVFRKKEDRVFLNLLNLDGDKVTVKVVDSRDRVLFKEVFEGEMLIEKAFNFEEAYKGRYTVVVSDSNSTYYETMVIR